MPELSQHNCGSARRPGVGVGVGVGKVEGGGEGDKRV